MGKIDKNINMIEMNELLRKLSDAGYAELVDTFLMQEQKVYTRRGRLNKSSACRLLGWKSKQLEETLIKCREILGNDVLFHI